jgi:hypothetical protein
MSIKKNLIVGAFLCLFAITMLESITIVTSNAKPLGWWEKHSYTDTIHQGYALHHQYQHNGAISAMSFLISSSGQARLTYNWQEPWLFTDIENRDTKDIVVTWEEDFYVV